MIRFKVAVDNKVLLISSKSYVAVLAQFPTATSITPAVEVPACSST